MQDSGPLDLTSVDFVSSEVGWAVGTHSVLATSDGGARWAALPEPCPLIRSVHFVSPDVRFAVAGGRYVSDAGLEAPEVAGVVLASSDGGHSWAQATAGVTPVSARYPYTMIVQCAGAGSAWPWTSGPVPP